MNSQDNIKSCLPSFLFNDEIFNKIILSIGSGLDNLNTNTDDLLRQLFPQTCTWSIDLWESLCAIDNKGQNIEARRSKLIAKLANITPITLNRIRSIIRIYTKDTNADIEQIFNEYLLTIKYTIKSKTNLQELSSILEEIKPAHLDINFIINLKQNESDLYIGATTLCGENITVYPWSPKNIESKCKINISLGSSTGFEGITIYPKKE